MENKTSHQKDGEDASRLFSQMDIWASERAGFHVPGHCGGRFFNESDCTYLIQTDTTELSATDDFLSPQNHIKKALDETALIFGSAKSFFISSGSTTGIRVMLASIVEKNTHILLSRQVHLSVLTAISLLGCKYSFIEKKKEYSERDARLWHQPDPDEIEEAVKKDQGITDILITSPNYYGDCASLQEIALIAHRHHSRLLVDEAHGAHFAFTEKNFPTTALNAGADMCVQSTHKTLPALTMASLVHVSKEAVTRESVSLLRVKYALRLFETSSPSFVIGASNYMAIKRMSQNGKDLYRKATDQIYRLVTRLRQIDGLNIFAADAFSGCDPMRVVISFLKLKYSAISVARALEKQGIYSEYADLQSVIFVFSPFQHVDDFELLGNALEEIIQNPKKNLLCPSERLAYLVDSFQHIYCILPEKRRHVREAMWSGFPKRFVSLFDACGCENAEVVMLCPPGIPLLWPGEIIEKIHVEVILEAISEGVEVYGVHESKICVIGG